jgi:hypothetical protein
LALGDGILFSINLYIDINLDSGTILSISGATLDSGVTDVGNGWYRAWLTRGYSGAGTTRNVSISVVTTAGLDSYTGDGLSGIYIWGAQYEEGYISDYDRTGPAAATRADTLKAFNTIGGTGSFILTGNDTTLLLARRRNVLIF